jgi:hypothetical protein
MFVYLFRKEFEDLGLDLKCMFLSYCYLTNAKEDAIKPYKPLAISFHSINYDGIFPKVLLIEGERSCRGMFFSMHTSNLFRGENCAKRGRNDGSRQDSKFDDEEEADFFEDDFFEQFSLMVIFINFFLNIQYFYYLFIHTYV